jgi:hypothetical protein
MYVLYGIGIRIGMDGDAMRCDVTQTVDFPIRSGCTKVLRTCTLQRSMVELRGTGVALLVMLVDPPSPLNRCTA